MLSMKDASLPSPLASGELGRVAVCHEWLTTYGGSDQVAARIANLVDARTVYCFTKRDEVARLLFHERDVRVAHWAGSSRWARAHWQWFLPVMPYAWRRLDLSGFDTVITSSHAFTNAIRVRSDATHISYCYTPIRYAWEWRTEARRLPAPLRLLWPAVASWLRAADRRWAQRVDGFIAISQHVAGRIRNYYSRDAQVVYPPVDTNFWLPDARVKGDFFLVAGRFVAYKQAHVAVEAISRLGLPLVVAGSGPELPRMRRVADPDVRFVPNPTNEELRELYRSARALVFPGVEDFGFTLVEAQACGTPVIALGKGGAQETVVDGLTGILYSDRAPSGLIEGVRRFEETRFEPDALRENAKRFDASVFDARFSAAVGSLIGS